MGYKAIALKAIAKTLSMTMKIANVAKERNVPCFCADLTVNPILVDWNKNIAARLDPFPGANWRKTLNGVFNLDDDFYSKSGEILTDSDHYMGMFGKNLS